MFCIKFSGLHFNKITVTTEGSAAQNFMKKLIITLTTLTLIIPGCSGLQVTSDNARKELQSAADSIKKDKKNIYKLDEKSFGRKGYFYIIRNNGRISYHPKKALINFDFSGYHFVKNILKERNGCLSFNTDGTGRHVFFREIDTEEILCLTIESAEFSEPVYGCDSKIEEKK